MSGGMRGIAFAGGACGVETGPVLGLGPSTVLARFESVCSGSMLSSSIGGGLLPISSIVGPVICTMTGLPGWLGDDS